jgi:hypothetical protein
MWAMPKCYKQASCNNEFVVRQSSACKYLSTEAKNIFGIRHQATTGEDKATWEDFMCAVIAVIFVVCNSETAVVIFCKSWITPITYPNPVYSH